MVNYILGRDTIKLENMEKVEKEYNKEYSEKKIENTEEFQIYFENGYTFKTYIYDITDFIKVYILKKTNIDPKRNLQNYWLDNTSFASVNLYQPSFINQTLEFTFNLIDHFVDTEAITRFQNQLNETLYDAIVYDIPWIKELPEYILLSEPHKTVFWELYEEIKRRMNTRIVRWETEVDTISDGNMGFLPGWGLDSPNPKKDPEPWPPNKFPTMESL